MPDLTLMLILVLALAAGLTAAIVIASHTQATGHVFYRSLLTNILLFNLLILSGMVHAMLGPGSTASLILAMPVLLLIMAALKLAWLLAFIQTLSQLQGARDRSRPLRLKRVGIIIFVVYTLLLMLAWVRNWNLLSQLTVTALEFLIIAGALLAAMRGVVHASNLPESHRRTSSLQFTLFHAVLMALILASLVDALIFGFLPQSKRVMTNGVLLLLFNIFPIWWIRRYRPSRDTGVTDKFERYGVTARERQIVELIQLGKTNQEIAESLFISVATVKDHNNRIFRKCGVRNRTELAKLFAE